ncbi:S-adenosylmethionine carrier 1, chloroplastic/mitochondrial-like [Rosa rugosa]|uniref:S-adenosylmethionine carrier 1, chloroplastic/mitochondrial-like n=1 Tax=Rosa rugosa TaxID=74645 RepID=UPI002B415F1C|nr:S-adenosylmethionine carrier 1, chloroplastic/mitochondrial-like [Rosa rugosa]
MFPENLSALAHFVVKQRMQTGQFTSASVAVRLIAAKEGFKGLYAAKRELNDPENAIIGAFAGALTGAITTPLDVIKTRLIVQVRPSAILHDICLPLMLLPNNMCALVVKPEIYCNGPIYLSIIYMRGCKIKAKSKLITNYTVPPMVCSHFFFFFLKRDLPSANQYKGIVDCVQTIVREEGPPALLKGIGPRVLWIGIGSSIFFGVLERTKRLLAQRRPTVGEDTKQD